MFDSTLQKKVFLDAYEKTFGNITLSCKACNVSRQTYYNWIESDKVFAKNVKEVEPKEIRLDLAESKLIEKIKNGDITSIIFFLKTQGKDRGYIERSEHDLSSGGEKISIPVINWIANNEQSTD